MTPDPACVLESDTIAETIEVMKNDKYGSLPVTNAAGKLVGVITDRDITLRIDPTKPATEQHVRNLMSKIIIPIDHDDSLDTAWRLMKNHGIRRLLVTRGGKELVGIISRSEIRARIIVEMSDYLKLVIAHENVSPTTKP